MDPIRVLVRRGATVESTHVVHAVAVEDGARGRRGRRPGPGHLHALGGEAVPGAAPRPRARRSRRPRPRDRVGIAPRGRRPARRRARLAGEGSRARGRARVRAGGPSTGRDPAQLLGQARRDARPLSGAGLGQRRLPAGRPSGPAGRRDGDRRGGRHRGRRGADRGRRLRRRHGRPPARPDGAALRPARGARRQARGWPPPMRAYPEADSRARGARHGADAAAAGAGWRRVGRRAWCARPGPAASGSRSRWRTETVVRSALRWQRFSRGSATRSKSWPSRTCRTRAARWSARLQRPCNEGVRSE